MKQIPEYYTKEYKYTVLKRFHILQQMLSVRERKTDRKLYNELKARVEKFTI